MVFVCITSGHNIVHYKAIFGHMIIFYLIFLCHNILKIMLKSFLSGNHFNIGINLVITFQLQSINLYNLKLIF